MSPSHSFETEPINKLLRQQAVPAAVGIMVMSIYGIVDTIFVGHWVGALGIGAITVVLPITFLISSIGMAIGVGGASVISRALGTKDKPKALLSFGNQISSTLLLGLLFALMGGLWMDEILTAFGGKGEILQPAEDYFRIILLGIPFLAWAMMTNNVIRAEGHPRYAMFTLIVPAVTNIILDPVLIIGFDMGLQGAAWATTISFIFSAAYTTWFFFAGRSGLRIHLRDLMPSLAILREIFSIGSVTFARQGIVSLLFMVLNNTLFAYGGEMGVAVFGIINRVLIFANFPVLGITQGFLPIAGFNHGAARWERVRQIIRSAIIYGTAISIGIFILIMAFAPQIVSIFTDNADLIKATTPSLRLVFLGIPLITIQLVGSAYFQAIGQPLPALLLTLTKQGFFMIPLILTLPLFFDLKGIWIAFPVADILSAAVVFWYLNKTTRKTLQPAKNKA